MTDTPHRDRSRYVWRDMPNLTFLPDGKTCEEPRGNLRLVHDSSPPPTAVQTDRQSST